MYLNRSPGVVIIITTNSLWHINAQKALTQAFNVNNHYVFTTKLEWFYNQTLSWKNHLFLFLLGQKSFASSHQTQKRPIFIPTSFCFLFSLLLTCTNPNILMDAKQWVRAFFYWGFLGLPLFINIVLLKKSIFITIIISMITTIIIIVITPHIYPFPCNKPIKDKLQRGRVIFHCFITHLLCFKTVRDTVKCIWHGTHYFVAYFLCPKRIRDK